MKNLIFSFLLFAFSNVNAQTKYEKEERILPETLPKNIMNTLKPYLEEAKQIRFFKEFDGKNISYEAKFHYNKRKYSVEYNDKGELEDIEIRIKPKEISKEAKENITKNLNLDYNKHKIKKVQLQYPHNSSDIKETLLNAFEFKKIHENNYELIVAVKSNKGYENLELLYSGDGLLLSSKKIVDTPYEHILY